MITSPCLVCGHTMKAESVSALLCGPACSQEQAARERSREENLKPGDRDYRPANDEQVILHKRAL